MKQELHQLSSSHNGDKFRRRSSATHPLSPSSSARRSRPNSIPASPALGSSTSSSFIEASAHSHPQSENGVHHRSFFAFPSTFQASVSHSEQKAFSSSSRRNSGYSDTSSVEPRSVANSPCSPEFELPPATYLNDPNDNEAFPKLSPERESSSSSLASPRKAIHRRSTAPDSPKQDAEESEASEPTFAPSIHMTRSLGSAKSLSTLKPSTPFDPTAVKDNGAEHSPKAEPIVIIRDFGFPYTDPRYKGLTPFPDPINIPLDTSMTEGSETGSWYSSHSGVILSCSSSSSLDDNFVPPPFGSFGFGHAYHQPQRQLLPQPQSQPQLSPSSIGDSRGRSSIRQNHTKVSNSHSNNHSHNHDWTTWGRQIPSEDDFHTTHGGSGSGSSKYSWNFVTESEESESTSSAGDWLHSKSDDALPSTLLDSALCINDFDDSDENEESHEADRLDNDTEYTSKNQDYLHTGRHGSGLNQELLTSPSIPSGGLLYRAMYSFSPEAPQEMRLNEGDLVRVWEQLCDGWVVGGKVTMGNNAVEEEVETGLIPQNYLALEKDSHSTRNKLKDYEGTRIA